MNKNWTLLCAAAIAFALTTSAEAGTVNRVNATQVNNTKTVNPTVVTVKTINQTDYQSTTVHQRYNSHAEHLSYYDRRPWNDWEESSVSSWTTTDYSYGETNYTYEVKTSVEYAMIDGVLTKIENNNVIENSTRTDTKTVTTHVRETITHYDYYADPIVLDVKGTGKITTARNEWLPHVPAFYGEFASNFDFTGDGIANSCEWLSNDPDPLLCIPKAGKVNGVTELFGNLGGYANGFDKLSVLCDADGNGVVEGSELDGLMLWVDSNRNGVSDPGELHTLADYGVAKLYTEQSNFVGKYETADGQTHKMWSWWPTVAE